VRSFLSYWLPLLVYASVIYYLSSIPHLPRFLTFYSIDKLSHVGEYAILGILVIHLLKKYYPDLGYKRLKIFTVLLSTLYGVCDEFHQYFVPFRDANLFDLFADGIGSLLGAFIYIHLTDKGK